jgi:hypothetical protein
MQVKIIQCGKHFGNDLDPGNVHATSMRMPEAIHQVVVCFPSASECIDFF